MTRSANTLEQRAITASPVIASLWKLIAVLILFFHWQILTSLRTSSCERQTFQAQIGHIIFNWTSAWLVFPGKKGQKTQSQLWNLFKIHSLWASLSFSTNSCNLLTKVWKILYLHFILGLFPPSFVDYFPWVYIRKTSPSSQHGSWGSISGPLLM